MKLILKENTMLKFKVGDTVVLKSEIRSVYLNNGVEYTVDHVADHTLIVVGVAHSYDHSIFELVVPTGELTDKEVFNAIVEGKPLQYQFTGHTSWNDLKYPEKLTLLDVQRGTYRVRPTDVKLECTVPYPEYSVGNVYSNKVRKYSVDFGTGKIRDFGEAELPSGGVFWSSREQAEKFRDTVLASLQGK